MSSFSALSELTVPSARVWFDLAIALKCFGVSISYLMVFGSLAPRVVTSFLGDSAPAVLVDRQLWITFAIVVLTPIAFLKSFTALRHTSYIALIAVRHLEETCVTPQAKLACFAGGRPSVCGHL